MLLEFLLEIFIASLFLEIIKEGLFVGINDDDAVDAVKDHDVAGLDRRGDVLESHGSRDPEGPGKDCRVGCPASGIGSESQDLVLAHHEGVRGCQIMCNDHCLTLDIGQTLLLVADEVPQDAFAYLLHIVFALAQILVLDRVELEADRLDRLLQRPFGIKMGFLDAFDRAVNEHLVLEQHDMRIEDIQV